jgi:competence ComEA-like helix-hairpin-helix protein
MLMKPIWKDYFTFSKKERNAVFILMGVLAVIIALPLFIPPKKLQISIDENLQRQLDKYTQQNPRYSYVAYDSVPSADTVHQINTSIKLFQFDPNTLDEQGFKELGLSDKVVHTIINYRNKGGYFKTPQDFKKIYGLSNTDAEQLIPYIKLTAAKNNNYKKEEKQPIDKPAASNTNYYHTININSATAEEWKTLPGIGDIIANRILKFRNSMGGFKSVDDVKKTYGLSDSTFNLIRPYLILK